MNKAQKVLLSFFIISIIVIAGLYAYYIHLKSDNTNISEDNALYYSLTCQHCKIVEEFISENNITEKIKFESKEISKNQINANEMINAAVKCNMNTQSLGVPFLYYDGKCYMGDKDIIDFLNKTLEEADK